MLISLGAMLIGVVVLVWSAGRFVGGAAAVATRLGMSQLLVGMIIVGFGTSLPEMLVSAISAWQGSAGIALGNAYGSNTANITLILGVAAVANPIPVNIGAVRRDIPVLLVVTGLAALQIWWDRDIGRPDALVLLIAFAAILLVNIRNESKAAGTIEATPQPEEQPSTADAMPFRKAVFWVVAGLLLLMGGSRLLVWGAVEAARGLGVGDLTIGLTIVAVGTSLPELASSLAAARQNRHDIALGNVIGSNLFNTLAVVGIAGLIAPMTVDPAILSRDMPAMGAATVLLFLVCVGKKGKSPIVTRAEGFFLLAMFAAYTIWVVLTSA